MSIPAALVVTLLAAVLAFAVGYIAGIRYDQSRQDIWGDQMRHNNARLRAGLETLNTEFDRQEVEIGRLVGLVRWEADALLRHARSSPDIAHALISTRAALLRKLDVGDPARLRDHPPPPPAPYAPHPKRLEDR